ncbi:MAG: triose-phosphate isomerase [Candidatus Aminicenantes bacterium]|nr:triose-phosphate isomerase [Candidatus Aminicenantes bacterium]
MTHDRSRPLLAGNWKMHQTLAEARALASAVAAASRELAGADIILAPPFTALAEVRRALAGSPVGLAGQNLFWEEKGAFTGEVSAPLLKDAGCSHVIIGHSERRQHFGETDASVRKKIKSALQAGLVPIVCVGESLGEREAGRTMDVIAGQLEGGLDGLDADEAGRIVLAYEPVWAIGTGRTASPDQAEEVHGFIRGRLEESYGGELSSCAIILYGGSVKAANTCSLFKEKDIDGALVGGASLEPGSFIEIVREAIKGRKERQ